MFQSRASVEGRRALPEQRGGRETFSVLMRLILGSRYSYDSFGALSRGVVVVETDGTYHALDVLKTAYDGATVTGCSRADTPVREL